MKKHLLKSMNKGNGNIAVRLKHAVLANITMMNIDKYNKLPKRRNKNQAENLEYLRIRNDDIDELLEETFIRDKFDTKFGIEDGVECSEDSNED